MTRPATTQLATFAAGLRFEAIPEPVIRKAEGLLVDWFGACLAGRGSRPVEAVARFADSQGSQPGKSQILLSRTQASPYFAAMVNAAASHGSEQADAPDSVVFRPATVVFPVALALAQSLGTSGKQLLTAVVVGYEAGIRAGEVFGPTAPDALNTIATAGALAAAATAGNLLGLSADQMQEALATAGSYTSGLRAFLGAEADSRQCHTAQAAAAGLMSASLTMQGANSMTAGIGSDADIAGLTDGLGTRWATAHTSCLGDTPITSSRDDISATTLRLALRNSGANADEMRLALDRLWSMVYLARVGRLLGSWGSEPARIADAA
jgi:2-methylcitrate dehydratase PrpD